MKTNLIDTLYSTYVMTEAHGDPDLTIGLARLRYELRQKGQDITQADDVAIREFIGRNSAKLAKAYKGGRVEFVAIATALIKAEEEAAKNKVN